jgi:uncharacterized membrane protein
MIVISATIVFGVSVISFNLWWCRYVGHSGWILFAISCVLLAIFELVLIPYMIRSIRRGKQIQIVEGTYVRPHLRMLRETDGQIYGAFGGSIFGSLVWLFRITAATDDWGTFRIVLVTGILIFLIATKLYLRVPQHGFKIASGVFVCVGLLNLIVVNLRWDKCEVALKDHRVTLAQINRLIIGVAAVLILVALIADWRHQKMRKSNSASNIIG